MSRISVPCDESVRYMGVVVTHLDRPSLSVCNRVHALTSHVQGCPCHDKIPFKLLLGSSFENI
jgi:hypothetical protein